jgi:penicillin-binding protein 1A
VERYLKEDLQKQFDRNNKGLKNWPFTNSVNDEQVAGIMKSARRGAQRYLSLQAQGYTEKEILKNFKTPTPMRIFSWDGEIDT